MVSVDTNILIRLITDDDVEQAERATSLVRTTDVLVPLTVMLETEWVLRSRLGFPAEQVIDALLALGRVPTVNFEQPARARKALAWARGGLEFADALHLASSEECESVVSFDRKFRRLAARLSAAPPVVQSHTTLAESPKAGARTYEAELRGDEATRRPRTRSAGGGSTCSVSPLMRVRDELSGTRG